MQRIEPLADVQIDARIAALPKADLHIHQEERPRPDRVLARHRGTTPYDWRPWARHLLDNVEAGMPRLAAMADPDTALPADDLISAEETIIAKLADVLEEAAADGAILVEVRVGPGARSFWRPDFMALFREAEQRVQQQYPRLRAEAIGFLAVADDEHQGIWQRQFEACVAHAEHGLAGVDFVVTPYATDADPALWRRSAFWAAQADERGLGITVHAAEFSRANLDAALRMPGLRRLGHAVYATAPEHLEQIAKRRITVECCLSCNVVLGAVPAYEDHPIRLFMAHGVPVTLNTDDPVRIWTTIGREYAIAAMLGLSSADLLQCTRNAIEASFAPPERRRALLADLDT